jgi:hypothetical protein
MPAGLRFKPIAWVDMPMSARKCFQRTRVLWNSDGLMNGVEWFVTFAEPTTYYLRTREWRWFVAKEKQQ